jgi:nitrous oxidase accessory protein NosD
MVDCTTDPGALATALATATDGDTLAIQGTCKGTFEIAHSLTLAGSAGATLDAQAAGTVLTIDSGSTVVVSDLTITGGNGSAVGGIRNGGTLTLANSTVSGNSVTVPQFVSGVAGIFNQSGSVTLVNSTVSGNSASASVQFTTAIGGIASFNLFGSGSVTLVDSTVSGNSATSPSLAYGGILNAAPGSVAALTNSTVSGNSASATGGARAPSASLPAGSRTTAVTSR